RVGAGAAPSTLPRVPRRDLLGCARPRAGLSPVRGRLRLGGPSRAMWHDPDDRIKKAVERFEDDDPATARRMLRALERQGVISPRIELYLGHCHLEDGNADAALRRY